MVQCKRRCRRTKKDLDNIDGNVGDEEDRAKLSRLREGLILHPLDDLRPEQAII